MRDPIPVVVRGEGTSVPNVEHSMFWHDQSRTLCGIAWDDLYGPRTGRSAALCADCNAVWMEQLVIEAMDQYAVAIEELRDQ